MRLPGKAQARAARGIRMRSVSLALALLVTGCVASTPDDGPEVVVTGPTAREDPSTNESAPAVPVGERMVASAERLVFLENRTIGILRPGDTMDEIRVPEPVSGAAFFTSAASPIAFQPFASLPFRVPYETTAEFDITMSFVSSAPAVATTPSTGGFPTVGGWFGTPERYAFFIGVADAPPSLDAGRVYTVKMRVPLPTGGFFVREGEQVALMPYINYQSADNRPIQWVLGGPEPAGFTLPHSHFNVSAPNAVVVLDESGETGPNPGFMGEQNPQPASFAFSVPLDTVYVVLEVSGAPKAGASIDIDGSIRTPSGDVLAVGSSPFASEVALIGPSALAAAGRDLVAHVTSSASASGGAFRVVVTAYVP